MQKYLKYHYFFVTIRLIKEDACAVAENDKKATKNDKGVD
jgi:hypothetical protein